MNQYQIEHRRNIADWVSKESWNYFITLRPLKTRLTESNIHRFMTNIFKIDWVTKLFYVLETDRGRMSSHSHIALSTTDVLSKQSFAEAIKRNPVREVKYFEKVNSKIGMANYMSKHIGNERYVKSYDMLVKDQVINSEIDLLIEHPNREYHIKQKIYSEITSGKALKGNSYMIPKSRDY